MYLDSLQRSVFMQILMFCSESGLSDQVMDHFNIHIWLQYRELDRCYGQTSSDVGDVH